MFDGDEIMCDSSKESDSSRGNLELHDYDKQMLVKMESLSDAQGFY